MATDARTWTARSAGDVNGDGYGDVVLGAYGDGVFLYQGNASGLGTTPGALIQQPVGMYNFGATLGCGDFNGDGLSDVIVGAYSTNNYDGAAYLYMGTASGLSNAPVTFAGAPGAQAAFGSSFSVADVNADGFADVVISAYRYNSFEGRAFLYMGGPSGLSSAPLVLPNPHGAFGSFGIGQSGVGDVNGDGFDDFVIGAYLDAMNVGAAYLYLGGPAGPSPMPAPLSNPYGQGAYFGNAVAGGGDVDGDGLDDVAVEAEGANGNNVGGAVWYRGTFDGVSLGFTLLDNPDPVPGTFGWSVGM